MSTEERFPSILEIGPGRGDFLIHLATEFPAKKIAAIEYKRKRYEKLVRRTALLANVTLYFGDARLVLPLLFPEKSLEEVYILFADPWPKRRHAKHRLFQQPFIEKLYRRLRNGGKIVVATDDPAYREQVLNEFANCPALQEVGEEFLFPTFYAQKWLQEGRHCFNHTFRRVD